MKVLFLQKEQKINTTKTKELRKTVRFYDRFFLFSVVLCVSIAACSGRKELLQQEIFDGPIMQMSNVNTMMTDSGKLVMKLKAPKQLQYDNSNKDWPEGLILEYYRNEEVPVCTFKSNRATYDAKTNIYVGEGNVIVQNIETKDELNTETLFWSPIEARFYTNSFVTIVSYGEIHTGEGLTANQDFSAYQIIKPSGTIQIKDEFETN